jgi:hypothetical protein
MKHDTNDRQGPRYLPYLGLSFTRRRRLEEIPTPY